ncbi:hypothetical protein [Desulfuromonas sp. DDH964]|uniref:hypothetical protein n=1 Tax=Desulfuromonas sp. DDH964 TaxID=1823759 RepID=UPI001E287B26|nr:hypothetical protein [Desulfuromonas sp. DDH964]
MGVALNSGYLHGCQGQQADGKNGQGDQQLNEGKALVSPVIVQNNLHGSPAEKALIMERKNRNGSQVVKIYSKGRSKNATVRSFPAQLEKSPAFHDALPKKGRAIAGVRGTTLLDSRI